MNTVHTAFTLTSRPLQRTSFPMRLFEKAKRFGIWNPSDLDFSRDRKDWLCLEDSERDLLLRLTALFQAGEEAVTLDLLPLIQVIASEGRIEEEMFLTSFLWEEAKHTDFFNRFLTEVVGDTGDLARYHTPGFRELVYNQLPIAMHRLRTDASPLALAEASLTYNMIVEGVLAETGYHAYFTVIDRADILPAQRRGIALLKQDESRHIAYGIYLLSRLIAEHDELWDAISERMNLLIVPALAIVEEAFAAYDVVPFGLKSEDFYDFAFGQFQRRLDRIERSRKKSLAEITVEAMADAAL